MPGPVSAALERFVQRARELTPDREFPPQPWDPDWPSACVRGAPDSGGRVRWQPVAQSTPVDFSGLEHALELSIHPDVKDYYGTFWSAGLEAQAEEGPVTLIQLWNRQDFDRLIENLIGHALAKRRARQPFTLFFATTDPDSELFLSIDNASGQVLLEEPGRAPERIVDHDLASFLDRLTPSPAQPRIY